MPTFTHESIIDRPAAEVFRWHLRPDAIRKLIPPWEPVTVVQAAPGLAPGSRAVLRIRFGPVAFRWVAEHRTLEDRGPAGGEFSDVQIAGPFRRWEHRHIVEAVGDSACRLRDVVDYQLRGGRLAGWLLGGLVRRKLARMFKFRHEVTAREAGQA